MKTTKIESLGELEEVKEALLIELDPGDSTTLTRGDQETLVVISFKGSLEIRLKGKIVATYLANYASAPRIWWKDGDSAELCLDPEVKNSFRGLVLRLQRSES